MPWWTWVALAFFASPIVAAGVIAMLTLRSLNALQAVGERLTAALEDLAAKGEELERRTELASRRVESAEAHFDHLRTTLDRFSVLTWALGDVAKAVGELRSAVLVRK
jgi:hypothetical protein